MDKILKPKVPAFYFYMRGSIWHLMYIGYSHAMAIENTDKLETWIINWKEKTISTLTDMTAHYHSVVFKNFDFDNDTWMHRSASDPE